jgi:hypothetical protein
MKRIVVIGLAALVLLPAVDRAFAQDEDWLRFPYRLAVSLEGGIGMPLQPTEFNDLWNASFPLSFAVSYVLIPQIEVKGWVTYARWSMSEIPAKDAVGVGGVTEIAGGSITTVFYGATAKIIPFPKSRMMPYIEVGGGAFRASGENLTVSRDEQTIISNTMSEANGPAFLGVFGMEYAFNERWNVYAELDYYIGFTDSFAPGDLVRDANDPPAESGDIHIATVMLGIILKI